MRNETLTNFAGLAPITSTAARLSLWLAFVLLLSGCKQEVKTSTSGTPVGDYMLVAVNGNQLPAAISHEGATLYVRSGTFTINADGTCSSRLTFVPPSGTEATREVAATYQKEGSMLHMQWTGAGSTTGTLKGNTFTMDNEGMVLTYRK